MAENSKLKPPTLWERIRGWYGHLIYKQMGVRYGPLMFKVGPDWWFLDHYGGLWILKYTGNPDNPLIIIREYKR